MYLYEPVPESLTKDQAELIMGVQGNHWSHIDRIPSRVDRMIYPRLLALAERGWSPADQRNWENFSSRVDGHIEYLSNLGVALWVPPVGEWRAGEGSQKLVFDVTDRITGSGAYKVFFRKKAWEDAKIRIEEVSLWQGERSVAVDDHAGIAGWDWKEPDYLLNVTGFEAGQSYQLRVRLETLREGGGEIYLEPTT
jgi:hypothetical protein